MKLKTKKKLSENSSPSVDVEKILSSLSIADLPIILRKRKSIKLNPLFGRASPPNVARVVPPSRCSVDDRAVDPRSGSASHSENGFGALN